MCVCHTLFQRVKRPHTETTIHTLTNKQGGAEHSGDCTQRSYPLVPEAGPDQPCVPAGSDSISLLCLPRARLLEVFTGGSWVFKKYWFLTFRFTFTMHDWLQLAVCNMAMPSHQTSMLIFYTLVLVRLGVCNWAGSFVQCFLAEFLSWCLVDWRWREWRELSFSTASWAFFACSSNWDPFNTCASC